jgi:two-component system, chemotaxis family, protein-glutamate methylesterase/glutaminase
MAQIDLVVIGASAGGLRALSEIVSGLPPTLSVAIVIVVHTRAEGTSFLPDILSRDTTLPVSFARHRARLRPGHIYVAPPDRHLFVDRDSLKLTRGPKENGFRPAVDPLFRTAARAYGASVMGIILSGALDDGTYGLMAIKACGGIAVAQDPEEATHPVMPLNAIRYVQVDHVLRASAIASLIANGSNGTPAGKGAQSMKRQRPAPRKVIDENQIDTEVEEMQQEFGPPSGLTCPDCGGALWELHDGALTRYRCHVGHQFSLESLDAEQQEALEDALWTAVRMLEERAALRQRMAERAETAGLLAVSSGFARTAEETQRQARTIRELLLSGQHAAQRHTNDTNGQTKKGARSAAKSPGRTRSAQAKGARRR